MANFTQKNDDPASNLTVGFSSALAKLQKKGDVGKMAIFPEKKVYIRMIRNRLRAPPMLEAPPPPIILGYGGPPINLENANPTPILENTGPVPRVEYAPQNFLPAPPPQEFQAQGSRDVDMDYLPLLTISPIDTDVVAYYKPWENTFNWVWDKQIDLEVYQNMYKSLQDINAHVEYLQKQGLNVISEVGSLNHRMEQTKNFAHFAIQWLTHLEGTAKGLTQATHSALVSINERQQQVGEAINATRVLVQHNHSVAAVDSANLHTCIDLLANRVEKVEFTTTQILTNQEGLKKEINQVGKATETTFTKITEQIGILAREIQRLQGQASDTASLAVIKALQEENTENLNALFENYNGWTLWVEGKIKGQMDMANELRERFAGMEQWAIAQSQPKPQDKAWDEI